jgi:hypothetical protein
MGVAMARERRRHRRKLTRREFLAGSAAAGAALGMPSLLAGCGDDDDGGQPPGGTPSPSPTPSPTPGARPREQRTLHFDLSFAEVSEPRLRVLLGTNDGIELTPHTAETRAQYREQSPLLRGVADDRLTHFAADIDLPSDSLQHLWVEGRHAPSGEEALLGLQIHVPRDVRRTLAAHRRASGVGRLPNAKMRAYGLERAAEALTLEDLAPALDEFVTPWDTAASLVFHHPEVMNLNLQQGPTILDLIQKLPCCTPADPPDCMPAADCDPFLATLAFSIAEHWPARTTPGGWATLVPVVDPETEEPLVDGDGKPLYRMDLAEETIAAAQSTIRNVLSTIFDDPQFEGSNWHALHGSTVRSHAPAAPGAPQENGFELAAEHPSGTTVHGVEFIELRVDDPVKRKLTLGVKNHFLRSHAVHLQFANEAGPLPVADPGDFDSERAKFADLIATNDTIMGIPLTGDLLTTQEVSIQVPAEASKVVVYFGSLGVGGDPFCPEAVLGSIFTLIINIAVPVIALAVGVAFEVGDAVARSKGIVADTSPLRIVLGRLIRRGLLSGTPGLGRGIFASADSGNAIPFLSGLINLVIAMLSGLPSLLAAIFARDISKLLIRALVNVGGIASRLITGGAIVADLVESVGEVLTNPPLLTNTLSLVMTTKVVIEHDPNDFRFPARARHYEVTLIYDRASKLAHKQPGEISPARVEPIEVVFEQVPSGGQVTVEVVLTTEEGYLIGRSVDAMGKEGPIGPLPNTPEQAGELHVPIKEHLIPLTQSTRYLHDLELKYENGERVWMEGPAPATTRAALCQGQEDRLCNLGGITVSQRTGMAGYSFEAGGQGNRPYCGESGGGVMHLVQNLFLGDKPERGLKVLPCGFRQPAGIVYERLGLAMGRHFFFEPSADGRSYYLESVVLDESTPFMLNSPLAWGRFTQALESVAVVPTGYVVGVSRLNHKMEILQLPATAVDRAEAPQAVPFAVVKAGEGTRVGLLNAPVAVAVLDATILVLETGNARIQAFDVSGNPVRVFQNKTSATVELEKAAELEYLDIGVDGLGYMYVLSAVNSGLAVGDYRLDVFTPQGNLLARTTGVAAARLAVDTFRNVYTLNYATVEGLPRVEPSLSQWVPSTPQV